VQLKTGGGHCSKLNKAGTGECAGSDIIGDKRCQQVGGWAVAAMW
jgi:hypothetical protein